MSKNPDVYLQHIIFCIDAILSYTQGMQEEDFIQNKLVQDAVIRNLEVIGEAAKQIPVTFKNTHTAIPWRRMAGMCDKLIHQYMGVDLVAVWVTIQTILPGLKTDLARITNST
jgi:uncharacterized protein with HEPN domain